MEHNFASRTLVSVVLVLLTGCTSPAGTQTTQQQINDALKRAPHGSVELTVDYCTPHKAADQRKQVVEMGQRAVFIPTASAPYEMKVIPVQSSTGDLVLSLSSKWIERVQSSNGGFNTDVIYSSTVLVKNGVASQPITFKVSDAEACLTLTANTRLAVSSANSVESVHQAANGQ
ncbi:hypothetical protein ABH908_000164 [Pseudomonas frederiksbergensis]|uniref:hypothetical protein n=1 Tax=Pseudomonas TaxID=286 RepID=UPI003D1A1374